MPAPSAPANLYTTHMTQNLSMLSLILNATLLAQAVMLLLLLFSMASWTLIFKKAAIIRTARAQTDRLNTISGQAAISRRSTSRRKSAAAMAARWKASLLKDAGGFGNQIQPPSRPYGARCGAALDARGISARNGRAGDPSGDAGFHWLSQSVYRIIWHRLGHHEFLSWTLQRPASNACECRAWNCRSARRHRDGFIRGDSGRDCL